MLPWLDVGFPRSLLYTTRIHTHTMSPVAMYTWLENEHLRAYSEKTVPSLIRLGTISPNASKMLLNAWYGHCCGSSILGLGPGDLDLETLHGVDPPTWVWRGPSSMFGWLGDWFDSV